MEGRWVQIAEFGSAEDFANAAETTDAVNLGEGDRALVAITLPFAVPGPALAAVQAAVSTLGIQRWAEPYAEDSTIYIPVTKAFAPLVVVAPALLQLAFAGLLVVVAIAVYKFMSASEQVGGPLGLLLFGGLALIALPPLITSGSRSHNPLRKGRARDNPIDGTSVLVLGGVTLTGAALYSGAKRGELPAVLQKLFHDLSPGTFPAPGGAAGTRPPVQGPPGGQPSAGGQGRKTTSSDDGEYACFQHLVGNTHLEFEVAPYKPARQPGAVVTFTGRLTYTSPLGITHPAVRKTIEFYDASVCQAFAQVETDGQGFYSLQRPLMEDELNGYRVFALYRGERAIFDLPGLDPASTGVLTVSPQ